MLDRLRKVLDRLLVRPHPPDHDLQEPVEARQGGRRGIGMAGVSSGRGSIGPMASHHGEALDPDGGGWGGSPALGHGVIVEVRVEASDGSLVRHAVQPAPSPLSRRRPAGGCWQARDRRGARSRRREAQVDPAVRGSPDAPPSSSRSSTSPMACDRAAATPQIPKPGR